MFLLTFAIACSLRGGVLLALVLLGLLVLLAGWFGDDAHHALLETLLLEEQAVLVPDEVRGLEVEVVALHAPFEETDDVLVVGVGGERQATAVVHEFLELRRLVQAELVHGHFLLLALNVIIFLVLGATGETLPGEGSSKEVEQHVTDGLKIVTTGLLVSNVSVDGGVTCSAGQVLALSEGNVLAL